MNNKPVPARQHIIIYGHPVYLACVLNLIQKFAGALLSQTKDIIAKQEAEKKERIKPVITNIVHSTVRWYCNN